MPAGALREKAPARIVGGIVSFGLNNTFSFHRQEKRGMATQARRFLALYLFSMGLSLLLLYLLKDFGGTVLIRYGWLSGVWIDRWVYGAKLIADGTCFLVNFLVMKLYVFSNQFSVLAFVRSLLRISPEEEDPQEIGRVGKGQDRR